MLDEKCDRLRCQPLSAESYLTWPKLDEPNKIEPYEDLGRWSLIDLETLRGLWPQIPWPEQSYIRQDGGTTVSQGLTALDHKFVTKTELLDKIRRDNETIDFSLFPLLPEVTVLQLLETLATTTDDVARRVITRADISGNKNIGLRVVSALLNVYPNLAVLSLLHTSSEKLPLASLFDLFGGKDARTLELYHHDLFWAFTHDPGQSYSLGQLPNDHAPYGTVNRVVFLSVILQDDVPTGAHRRQAQTPVEALIRLLGRGLQWNLLLPSHEKFYRFRDSPFFYADIPLHDAF